MKVSASSNLAFHFSLILTPKSKILWLYVFYRYEQRLNRSCTILCNNSSRDKLKRRLTSAYIFHTIALTKNLET